MIERNKIYIDGKWVGSSGDGVIAVINPATEEAIATIPRGCAKDVDQAARAAAAAFAKWSQTPVKARAAYFHRLAQLTEARADEITRTIVSEVGQPMTMAAQSQTAGAVEELSMMSGFMDEIAWAERLGGTVMRREASGVVGAITAWNAPLRSVISKAGAAMAAGCTVVVKGSEIAPLTAFMFAEMVEEAGMPPGVFNLVSGTGPEIGEAIVLHPLVDMVSLTGSVRAGRRVMELAAQQIKRVHLELGGKSANIISDDTDLERAITVGIQDAFRNSGQVCGGLTRTLVPRRLLAEAEALAVSVAERYVIGDPFDPSTTLGPVTTAAQHRRVRDYIRVGLSENARMLTGGPEMPTGVNRGYYVKPTIFSTDNTTRIAREEIFGPVEVIIPFDDEAEAVAIANDSPYGLAAAIWSSDLERARMMAGRLRVGRVRINGAPLDKRAAHGGFKLSGFGREWGRFGIEEFTEYKSVFG